MSLKEESNHYWSNYLRHVSREVIQCKDGSFLAMFRVRPIDWQSSSEEELNLQREAVADAFKQLGSGWGVYSTVNRHVSDGYTPPSETHFPTPIGFMIDHEIRSKFENVSGADYVKPYETEVIYSITYTPSTFSKQSLMRLLFKRSKEVSNVLEDALLSFEESLQLFSEILKTRGQLAMFRVGMLEEKLEDAVVIKSELVGILRGLITGDYSPVIVYDSDMMPDITDLIFTAPITFGSDEVLIDGRRIRCVVVHGFPWVLKKQVMRLISETAMPLSWTSRFITLDAVDTKKVLDVFKSAFKQSKINPFKRFFSKKWAEEDKSLAADAGEDLINETKLGVEKGEFGGGFYTSVITVYGDTEKEVDRRAKLIREALQKVSIIAQIEDVSTMEALMSTLPGNHYHELNKNPSKMGTEDSPKAMKERYRDRQHFGTTVHAASLMPTTGLWSGEKTHPSKRYPKNSPPLLYCDTTGNTPHRFTTFLGDLGHAFMLGQTGSGKSTLLNLMAVMQQKYKNGFSIILDKDYSFYTTTMLMGGSYYDLTATGENARQFCPLEDIDKPSEREWLAGWFQLIAEIGGIKVDSKIRREIRGMLEHAAETGIRNMTKMVNAAQVSAELKDVFYEYTKSGTEIGRLLDGEPGQFDRIQGQDMVCFEMGGLFKSTGMSNHSVPLSQYMFHLFEKLLDGRPGQVIIDEGHNWIREPENKGNTITFDFATRLEQWLLEMRKRNGYLLFATQNISAIANASPTLRSALLQSTASRIFLADKNALDASSAKDYKTIGLTQHELRILANARMPGDMLVFKKTQNTKGKDAEPKRRLTSVGMSNLMVNSVGVTDRDIVTDVVMPLVDQYGNDPLDWHSRFCVQQGVVESVEDYKFMIEELATELTVADANAGYRTDWKELWGIG